MKRPVVPILVLAAAFSVTAVAGAQAAPYSGLRHACKYTYGVGSYQDVSYAGATSCAEARGLIMNLTQNGKRKPRVGVRIGHTPHGTWRCRTIRWREVHGVISQPIGSRASSPTILAGASPGSGSSTSLDRGWSAIPRRRRRS